MEKYSGVTLDRDRAFDVNSLNELLTQGKAILNEATGISEKMEASISAVSGIYNGIESKYKVGALGSDLSNLKGKLQKEIYQNTIDHMDTILNKLMEDMLSYDSRPARDMDSIQEVPHSVKGRISERKVLLDTGDVGLMRKLYND